jgi:ubiquinone/menaquinone biosynthesis C-methylase UbiE
MRNPQNQQTILLFRQPRMIELKEKVLDENRRVHALESGLYLDRHPEQTNFYQTTRLRKTLDEFCRRLSGSNILDLGCGTGYTYLPLLNRGYSLTGVDLSKDLIEVLKDKVPAQHKDRSRLVVADAEEFAAEDDCLYDGIVFSAVLHHLFDYESVIKVWRRKLKPHGLMLVVFEPLKQKIISPVRYALHKTLSKLDESVYKMEMKLRGIPLLEEEYHLSDYQRQFGGIDPNKLTACLEKEQMELLEIEKYCARRYGINALIASHLLHTQNTFNLLAQSQT